MQPQTPGCNQWADTWASQVAAFKPDVSIILIGRWEIVNRELDSKWSHIGRPNFDKQLIGELRRAIEVASGSPATGQDNQLGPTKVVVLTMPYLGPDPNPLTGRPFPETLHMRVDMFNKLEYSLAQMFPRQVSVFDLGSIISPGGHFSGYLGNQTVKWPDGVHVTQATGFEISGMLFSTLSHLTGL